MQFQKHCLFCGRPNDSINYTCDCRSEAWFGEYRTLDVSMSLEAGDEDRIKSSFHHYSMSDKQGMLQYATIPYRRQVPESLPAVGITPLYRLSNMVSDFDGQLYIKNEGANPSGCFKDRETMVCLLNSLRRNLNKAVIYSSGNAAASAAIFAQKLNFQLITCVAGDTYKEKIEFIRDHGSDVIVIGDESTNFETGYRIFARLNRDGYFARNGFDNWSVRNPYRAHGDKTTALEVVRQLSENEHDIKVPDYVIIPTANGTCLAGMWKGFKELHSLGLITKLPRMVSVGVSKASPIYKMYQNEVTDHPLRCDTSSITGDDAKFGSIILAEEGYDSIEATRAILESGGLAMELHRKDVGKSLASFLALESRLTEEKGIIPEPASVMSVSGAVKLIRDNTIPPGSVAVAVMTGHGLKARSRIESLLADVTPSAFNDELIDKAIARRSDKMLGEAPRKGHIINTGAELKTVMSSFEALNIY